MDVTFLLEGAEVSSVLKSNRVLEKALDSDEISGGFTLHALVQSGLGKLSEKDAGKVSLAMSDGKPGVFCYTPKFMVVSHTKNLANRGKYPILDVIHVFKKTKKALSDGFHKKGDQFYTDDKMDSYLFVANLEDTARCNRMSTLIRTVVQRISKIPLDKVKTLNQIHNAIKGEIQKANFPFEYGGYMVMHGTMGI